MNHKGACRTAPATPGLLIMRPVKYETGQLPIFMDILNHVNIEFIFYSFFGALLFV